MKRDILPWMGLWVLAFDCGFPMPAAAQPVVPQLNRPALDPEPAPPAAAPDLDVPQLGAALADADADRPVKPLMEGPLNEAFLSPAKDREPEHVDKPPPPPIIERPGVASPGPRAEWIGGYWE